MNAHGLPGGLATLYAALADVDRPMMREFSVKAIGGELVLDRALVSFDRDRLGPGPARRLEAICAGLGAPAEGFAQLDAIQRSAHSVHFGHEPESGRGSVCKCYLEFAPETAPEPGLVFRALKWRADGAWAISDYRERTGLDPRERAALIGDILPEGAAAAVFSRFALGPGQPILLEVTEPGNARRSLDVTLIDAGHSVGDFADDLAAFLGGSPQARSFVDANATEPLGHVAAGTARDGRPFATLYYGAHGVHGPL